MSVFDLTEARDVLARTPATLRAMLSGLSEAWTRQNEGPDTWAPYDVVGHLIHGERTDWMARLRIILEHGTAVPFEKFDRFAQFRESEGRTLEQLLDDFAEARGRNLAELDGLLLGPEQLDRQGRHPALGIVTARQLLATWVAHDLDHLIQIARVMARRYSEDVGPWTVYMRVMKPL